MLYAEAVAAQLRERLDDSVIPLGNELTAALGRTVDVVRLEDASPDLVVRVLRYGVLLVDRDPAARIASSGTSSRTVWKTWWVSSERCARGAGESVRRCRWQRNGTPGADALV